MTPESIDLATGVQRAWHLHFQQGSDPALLYHSSHVSWVAGLVGHQLQEQLGEEGILDLTLVTLGGLLHDIGRTCVQGIRHGVAGADLLADKFPRAIALIAERHIGGGIPKKEAIQLGLPAKDYLPLSLEEKIVCYADKLVDYEGRTGQSGQYHLYHAYTYDTAEEECSKLARKLGPSHPAIERVRLLEEELWRLNRGRFVLPQISSKLGD